MKKAVSLAALVLATASPALLAQTGAVFTMEQTISDGAQRTTLAFDGLAMMTGNLEAQTFFPPGKVADYTGFQYLRDNDPDNMGHNTSFLTRIAYNVIYILNADQFNQLKTLAVAQQDQINLYGYKRYPLMKAFRRLLDGDVPVGSEGLDPFALKRASRELYLLDGQISFDRALLYANIIHSFDASQLAYLEAMKGRGWNSWPDITNDQIRSKMQGLPQGTAVAVMTYAGDLFSWYAGSLEADVYFCPERQGTYYGGFYIKDAPAIGHEGYSINEQLTATAGAALCDSSKGYVTPAQAATMSSLVELQRTNLHAGATNIVSVRTQIATLLRSLLVSTASSNSVRSQVLELSGIYGELDGEDNYYYATVFAGVYASLTDSQKTNLAVLRREIMSGTYADGTPFDFTVCTNHYLYSAVITDTNALAPYITNTDYLFLIPATAPPLNVVLGCPTADAITVSILPTTNLEVCCEYAATPGLFTAQSVATNLVANMPGVLTLTGLPTDTQCFYRARYRFAGQTNFSSAFTHAFHTQRAPGGAFTFSIQGDSHPERVNNMFESAHYSNTLATAAADLPDFYLTIGDDFSVDQIPTNLINAALVTERYTIQRPYLELIGHSAPLFLVNGNHEQAALYLLDGTSNNIAVWAQNARNTYYPQPAPDGFYTGNTNVVPHIGLLRNYFAWTWGDALFVTIDPYWGSPTCVDNNYWTGEKRTNLWDITHGDAQYQWLKRTLETSNAKYKFVFAHHVLGTGRGGIEEAGDYEWGGHNSNGTWGFTTNRPGWVLPIHQFMASNHVTMFFQGHDHIFAHQQLDGVTYLTLPNPADPTYSLFNSDAFTNVIYKTNNSGYVRLNVSAERVKVDYVRTYLPAEEGPGRTNGIVDYSFTIGASNQLPTISAVEALPPFAGSPVWITARVTDPLGLSAVTLNFSTGAASATNTVFLETMATSAVKPWTSGASCDNPWTVTGNSFEQRTNSNYGPGNPCGLEFKNGTAQLADNMITTARAIDARGNSGTVSFALWANGLLPNTGWTMQLDNGSGFTTRLSDLTGVDHNWQTYSYSLLPADLVSNLLLRFQCQGGASSNRINLDQIVVQVATGSDNWTRVAMIQVSNGLFAAQIPSQLAGATVNFFVSANNTLGLSASYPPAGAGGALSFVVTNPPGTPFDVLLGRPTDSSIALSVLPMTNLQILCQYGAQSGFYTDQIAVTNVTAGAPAVLTLNSLLPDTQSFYRLAWQQPGETNFTLGVEHTFHTARAATKAFTFDIEADPHWRDPNAAIDPALWLVALDNILADQPDFLIDLGDTFMAEKLGVTDYAGMAQLCREVRTNQFSRLGHSVPLFLANGNHEAELGWLLDGTANNPAVWATQAREYYFPCPSTNEFYSGSANRDGYYSFKWGNALFIVLDPFWFTDPKPGNATSGWGWTLGAEQYAWLQQTLSSNAVAFKFVFVHHLVGGSFDGEARGGLEFAPYFEWGGFNTNGTWGFTAHRPGWPMPIQDLLLSNNVAVVFHGHDHLFVKQDLDTNDDGVPELIYQECPQPSATNYNTTSTAAGYGYSTGVVQGNSGHLRVRVAPAQATVEYVRVYLPASEGAGKTNRMVSYSYTIPASTADSVGDGIPDWWRAQYYGGNGRGTNTASCATCDPDGDGVSNVLEYLADTNPTNAASYFAIEAVTVNPGNSVLFQSSPNRKYTLQSTTNLNSGAWSDVSSQTAIRGTGGVVSLTDSSPTTTQRFYRVEVRPL